MVARYGREYCVECGREFEGFGNEPGEALAAHWADAHPSPEIMEAREEVERFWASLTREHE